MKLLLTPDGRRAAALLFMLGGGIAMTIYAAWALYFVRAEPSYVLALGIAAHVAILVVLTGFAGLLVKRMIKGKFAGGEFEASDTGGDPASNAAATVAGAAVGAAEAIKGNAE